MKDTPYQYEYNSNVYFSNDNPDQYEYNSNVYFSNDNPDGLVVTSPTATPTTTTMMMMMIGVKNGGSCNAS
jgi:hypothetical protein